MNQDRFMDARTRICAKTNMAVVYCVWPKASKSVGPIFVSIKSKSARGATNHTASNNSNN